MKTFLMTGALLLATGLVFGRCNIAPAEYTTAADSPQDRQVAGSTDNTRIQVAILLDTSNSMDGLIDQAKSRLWNIINTLSTLKYKGRTPRLEIALYEYGNDGLSASSNYIRKVVPLSSDLDLISEKLFSLRTNGGEEYCGAVIRDAVQKLEWSDRASDMKLIYIAGNEPFDQGRTSYKESISGAIAHDVFVNTIFCGGYEEGIRTAWKDGATRGQGRYFNIDSDKKVRFIETPYDDRIEACNQRMNKTYIGYGAYGAEKKMNQEQQDYNAGFMSKANYAERAVSKSKKAYRNESWDLVDKVKEDKGALQKMKKEELPAEYKNKSQAEIETLVAEKAKEREAIQKEIEELGRQRQAYIDAENKKNKTEDDLGVAFTESILKLAKEKGYVVQE